MRDTDILKNLKQAILFSKHSYCSLNPIGWIPVTDTGKSMLSSKNIISKGLGHNQQIQLSRGLGEKNE
jgi:hypothetical protein